MSRLDEYVEGAVSTESRIDEVKVNKQFLRDILALHIASGNILDQIKKHAFYRRDYNFPAIDRNMSTMLRTLTDMSYMTVDELEDAETVLDIDPRIFHAIIGSATESVELLEALEFDGKEMDLVNIGEEYGDANWYQAIFLSLIHISEPTRQLMSSRMPSSA